MNFDDLILIFIKKINYQKAYPHQLLTRTDTIHASHSRINDSRTPDDNALNPHAQTLPTLYRDLSLPISVLIRLGKIGEHVAYFSRGDLLDFSSTDDNSLQARGPRKLPVPLSTQSS